MTTTTMDNADDNGEGQHRRKPRVALMTTLTARAHAFGRHTSACESWRRSFRRWLIRRNERRRVFLFIFWDARPFKKFKNMDVIFVFIVAVIVVGLSTMLCCAGGKRNVADDASHAAASHDDVEQQNKAIAGDAVSGDDDVKQELDKQQQQQSASTIDESKRNASQSDHHSSSGVINLPTIVVEGSSANESEPTPPLPRLTSDKTNYVRLTENFGDVDDVPTAETVDMSIDMSVASGATFLPIKAPREDDAKVSPRPGTVESIPKVQKKSTSKRSTASSSAATTAAAAPVVTGVDLAQRDKASFDPKTIDRSKFKFKCPVRELTLVEIFFLKNIMISAAKGHYFYLYFFVLLIQECPNRYEKEIDLNTHRALRHDAKAATTTTTTTTTSTKSTDAKPAPLTTTASLRAKWELKPEELKLVCIEKCVSVLKEVFQYPRCSCALSLSLSLSLSLVFFRCRSLFLPGSKVGRRGVWHRV
jgi:hypothetical protein